MGQLTLARWRGDTTFGLVSRILSTILGSAVGLAVWYDAYYLPLQLLLIKA